MCRPISLIAKYTILNDIVSIKEYLIIYTSLVFSLLLGPHNDHCHSRKCVSISCRLLSRIDYNYRTSWFLSQEFYFCLNTFYITWPLTHSTNESQVRLLKFDINLKVLMLLLLWISIQFFQFSSKLVFFYRQIPLTTYFHILVKLFDEVSEILSSVSLLFCHINEKDCILKFYDLHKCYSLFVAVEQHLKQPIRIKDTLKYIYYLSNYPLYFAVSVYLQRGVEACFLRLKNSSNGKLNIITFMIFLRQKRYVCMSNFFLAFAS